MCLLIGLAWKFASHEWSPVFAFNLLWTSTLANLLCQLFIKYECKQTNPLGSNWKVFACFIELCLLSIFLMLVYSVLLRFWGSSLEHFFFPSSFLLFSLRTQGRVQRNCDQRNRFSFPCVQRSWVTDFMQTCSLSCPVLSPTPSTDRGSKDSVPDHAFQIAAMRCLSKN